MSLLDLRLNMAVMSTECNTFTELNDMFAERAKIVRAGVRGSPRGQSTPFIAEYNGFSVVKLVACYELLFESTNAACGLPLNLCAARFLAVQLYGPVFLVRRVEKTFTLIKEGLFDTPHGLLLASVAPRRLDEFQTARTVCVQ